MPSLLLRGDSRIRGYGNAALNQIPFHAAPPHSQLWGRDERPQEPVRTSRDFQSPLSLSGPAGSGGGGVAEKERLHFSPRTLPH